jgi:ubiquitin carboxyl-terminal hydrolase 16/45
MDSLKAFTSVEVLEGENAFACKKCWKIKTGKYKDAQPPLREKDEDGLELHRGAASVTRDSSGLFASASFTSDRQAPPSISILGSDGDSDGRTSPADDRSLARATSLASNTSHSAVLRAPSPLRRQIVQFDADLPVARSPEVVSLDSSRSDAAVSLDPDAEGDPESDGLSDRDSSEDEEPPKPNVLPVGRPKLPPRRKSTHFVMRRAFKRYLIAKAPEVLVFHFKRFRQTTKTGLTFTSFYDLKK